MNILIDIGHPAHVHLFRYVAKALEDRGHKLFYTVRDIPVARHLMDVYGMPYTVLGVKKDSVVGKALSVLRQDLTMLRILRKNKIDVGLSSGIVLPQTSVFSRISNFIFDDDDDAVEKMYVRFAHPFADAVLTPDAITRKTKKTVYYPSTHELAYLHPNHFVPDKSVLARAGIAEGDSFFILRFVAFKGHHDVGETGLGKEQKRRLVEMMSRFGRVIITSEREIDPEFEAYRLPVPPEDIHSLMYYSSMFVGDSQTMTSEAAILGVPALKCNTFAGRLSVPAMIEKYGLCFSYTVQDFESFFLKIEDLLKRGGLKKDWEDKRKAFLSDMIDPVPFFADFIENYRKH